MSECPVSFPISSVISLAKILVLLDNSIHVEMQ